MENHNIKYGFAITKQPSVFFEHPLDDAPSVPGYRIDVYYRYSDLPIGDLGNTRSPKLAQIWIDQFLSEVTKA